ncbi:MAG TPA: hypothetical protein DCP69_04255 [Candidatus Omnitrophica bacterium]|nr:hypothetical protein [Candidatus Omnitrophota bacterium]
MPSDWQADLLQALQGVETSHTGDGLSTQEIADAMGWNRHMADRRICDLFRAGAIECCRKYITNRTGGQSLVPAYRKKAV